MMFWVGSVDDPESVVEWVHPAHHRSPYGCEIDGEWLNRYWFELADNRHRLRAQIHTHPGLAFHSPTDDQWPVVSQPGFISIVVPYFGAGPVDMNAYWVGILHENGRW
ncbi:MAG: hypothetical protein KJS98_19715, partial [Nitrospirae bacterium]|nr:hypothetical protein [Nitrospirota bacterium]